MDPIPTLRPSTPRSQFLDPQQTQNPTSGRGKRVSSVSPRKNNTSSSRRRPASAAQQQQQQQYRASSSRRNNNNSPPTSSRNALADNGIIGAKAAISALQHGVVGERNSSGMALEKQIAVNADVKSFAVVGSDVWMAHADGTLSVRDCRTGHSVDPCPLPSETLSTCDRLLGTNPAPWSLLAVTPLSHHRANHNNQQSSSSGGPVTITGCTVWVGFSDGNLEVFDAETRKSLGTCTRHHSGGIYTLACFSNNVFSGSNDFQISMWDANDHSFLRQFSGHNNYVRCLHAEGALLFSGSDDCTIRVWNVTTGSEISRATFHRKNGITAMTRVGPNMWTGDTSGDIIVWKLQTMREDHYLREHTGRINALKKVGRSRVYSAAADRLICVWDVFQHTLLHRVAEHNSWVLALAFPCSLTRHYVWTSAADATVRCFHHDEFTPMTATLENALEGAWYSCDYAPYRDLSESQNDELKSLNHRLRLLQDSERLARERASNLEMHLDRARAEITEIDIKNHKELENLKQMKAHFLQFQAKERDIYNQLHEAQRSRDEMLAQLQEIQKQNELLRQEATSAKNERDDARLQSAHMEDLLKLAVKAQQESKAAVTGAMGGGVGFSAAAGGTGGAAPSSRRTTTSPRTIGSARGGAQSSSPRSNSPTSGRNPATPNGSRPAGSYFSGTQRPLILVTTSVEHAKLVKELEEEIKELQDRCSRLARVNSQMGRSGRGGPASAAGSFRIASTAEKENNNNTAGGGGMTRRDWSSQAMEILNQRQRTREDTALAMSGMVDISKDKLALEQAATVAGNQVTFIPQPPSSSSFHF